MGLPLVTGRKLSKVSLCWGRRRVRNGMEDDSTPREREEEVTLMNQRVAITCARALSQALGYIFPLPDPI